MKPRPHTNDQLLIEVLTGLLQEYFERVPDALRIFELMKNRGDKIINDHIAFRAFECKSLLKVFLPYGYQVQYLDNRSRLPFNFKDKCLTAVWLKHPNADMPRIFISECRLEEFPQLEQVIAPYLAQKNDYIDDLNYKDTKAIIKYLHTPLWPTPSFSDYQALNQESEYLAWVFYNKYYLNHFTLSIHHLKSLHYQDIRNAVLQEFYKTNNIKKLHETLRQAYAEIMKSFNTFLKDNNFKMNSPKGNELNISPDGLLLQSSTKAQLIEADFPDGTHQVPGSYVEFAYRGLTDIAAEAIVTGQLKIEDLNRDHFKEGFELSNANNIFESTYLQETENKTNVNLSAFQRSVKKLNAFLDQYQREHSELSIFETS